MEITLQSMPYFSAGNLGASLSTSHGGTIGDLDVLGPNGTEPV
ncbi:MAG: hypothetical protein ACT4NU_00325 [Chromatiales bacterium]